MAISPIQQSPAVNQKEPVENSNPAPNKTTQKQVPHDSVSISSAAKQASGTDSDGDRHG